MIDLSARETEILDSLKDFQRATVERVVDRFRSGQPRMLVADEVGLGKTLVAKGVIAKVARWHQAMGDDIFRVVYICSNQSIARQNIMKLKIDKGVVVDNDTSTRLTMQTLKYFKQKNDPHLLEAFVQLIPLTPNTSFASTSGRGIKDERALIYAVLRRIPQFQPYEPALSRLLSMGVNDWEWWSKKWVEDEITQCGDDYEREVIPRVDGALLSSKYTRLREGLLQACTDITGGADATRYAYDLVHQLRRLMADISISFLDPDLVIMDEFQRFRELIRTDDQSEIGMLAKKFLQETECKVLLLSATPYKLYATLDEIADNNGADDHYREFDEVIAFLFGKQTEMRDAFRAAWESYSLALRQLEHISVEDYQLRKSVVEELLYRVMCRTERLQVATSGRDVIDVGKVAPLEIGLPDITSYVSADDIVQELSILGKTALPPVEYVKSAPYILSFMEHYQLKKLIKRHRDGLRPVLRRSTDCWIPRDAIEQYRKIPYPNARLNRLLDEAFAHHGELLMWVPPALPYYELGGPFKGSEGFSKILVFSAWEMVPRMIASIVSYEAERRTIGDPDYKPRSESTEKTYSPVGENQRRFPSRRLDFGVSAKKEALPKTMSLFTLLYPCRKLAELFDPLEMLGDKETLPLKRRHIESQLRAKLRPMIEGLSKYQSAEKGRRDAAWYWLAPILLDINHYGSARVASWILALRQQIESGEPRSKETAGKLYLDHVAALQRIAERPHDTKIGSMPGDLIDVLIRQALGSPATCALRALGQGLLQNDEENEQVFRSAFSSAHDIAIALRGKFNTPEAIAIIDRSYREAQDFHWKNVLRYCVDGNLQATLDEYSHMLSDSYALREYGEEQNTRELAKLISRPLRTTTATYKVDTYSGFTSRDKSDSKNLRMRSHYAVGFYNVQSDNSKDVQRTDQLRQAFNSPFWPFVLASTSIGQEGLDFHYYCRKIMHWNLPANPVDLEQREGRINRYKSLAIRHSAVQRYHASGGIQLGSRLWDDLFDYCEAHEKGDHCELIPYWYLEPSSNVRSPGYIERIIPMYPFSKDQAHYERLVAILSLYRITMGQPRQEELLDAISQHVSSEDSCALQELFILLSPYYRDNATEVD